MSESAITKSLLDEYFASVDAVAMSERELSRNQTEMQNRREALGKHIVPKDAKLGEKFSIWVRDKSDKERLLTVELVANGYALSWRQ